MHDNWVAPFMGAWIEICGYNLDLDETPGSHPSWVRGLKSRELLTLCSVLVVAPFMGAWIEMIR